MTEDESKREFFMGEEITDEKVRVKTFQEMFEIISKIDKLMELREKQGKLLVQLRDTLLLRWGGKTCGDRRTVDDLWKKIQAAVSNQKGVRT
jgi:phenylalanine-4-hydroxylase